MERMKRYKEILDFTTSPRRYSEIVEKQELAESTCRQYLGELNKKTLLEKPERGVYQTTDLARLWLKGAEAEYGEKDKRPASPLVGLGVDGSLASAPSDLPSTGENFTNTLARMDPVGFQRITGYGEVIAGGIMVLCSLFLCVGKNYLGGAISTVGGFGLLFDGTRRVEKLGIGDQANR